MQLTILPHNKRMQTDAGKAGAADAGRYAFYTNNILRGSPNELR